jgi:hypothetical protein
MLSSWTDLSAGGLAEVKSSSSINILCPRRVRAAVDQRDFTISRPHIFPARRISYSLPPPTRYFKKNIQPLDFRKETAEVDMPDRDVRSVEDLIYYQYAKIVAKSAFGGPDGREAKGRSYGFIKQTFRALKSGQKSWSETTREDWQFVQADERCIYCGAQADLTKEHIVPRSIRINERCPTCDKIQGIHNQIWACKPCNSAKGTLGLYTFYGLKHPGEKKYYDYIPPLLEKKYLKTIYNCHNCSGSLPGGDMDGDGEITVLDIDLVVRNRGT